MRFIIMAQGENARWHSRNGRIVPEVARKHLLPMGKYGAPIVSRTKIMLASHGVPFDDIITIAELEFAGGIHQVYTLTDPGPELLHGIRQLNGFWKGRTAILLGDVIFSHNLIDIIMIDEADLRFYGRIGPNPATGKAVSELFGFAFSEAYAGEVFDQCVWVCNKRGFKYPPKLWALYRLLSGFEYDEHKHEDEILCQPNDYTDDIDSVEEWKEFYYALNTEAAKDDDTCWCDPRRQEIFS